MNTTLRVILTILFNTASITEVILVLLSIAGMWKVFEKSSIPGWWALIPWARSIRSPAAPAVKWKAAFTV